MLARTGQQRGPSLTEGRAWRIVPGTSPEARWVRLPWRPEPEELARVCRHTAVLLQLIALDTRFGTLFWAEPKAGVLVLCRLLRFGSDPERRGPLPWQSLPTL